MKKLPKKIFAVEYGGFWDLNKDGFYGPSLLDVEANKDAEEFAHEICRRYNALETFKTTSDTFNRIIDNIESRCMATDGPVTPTLQEATEEELSSLWHLINQIKKTI